MAVNCHYIKEWIPHYIEGLLPDDMERLVALHIRTCPECAMWLEEAKEMARIWAEGGAASPEEEIPDLTGSVMAAIEEMEQERQKEEPVRPAARRQPVRRVSWVHYGVAACLTVLLAQFGVFEQLGYGITEMNGHMSSSVASFFQR